MLPGRRRCSVGVSSGCVLITVKAPRGSLIGPCGMALQTVEHLGRRVIDEGLIDLGLSLGWATLLRAGAGRGCYQHFHVIVLGAKPMRNDYKSGRRQPRQNSTSDPVCIFGLIHLVRPSEVSVPGSPHVTNIRFVFLVAAAVGPLHRDETVPFIEPLRRPIDLECPQLQTIGVALLRQHDELITSTVASPRSIKVMLAAKALVEDQQADHGTFSNRGPGLTLGYSHVAAVRPDLLISVGRRTVGKAAANERSRTSATARASELIARRMARSFDAHSTARWQMNNIAASRFSRPEVSAARSPQNR